ncbi:hypothetical protein V6N11_018206 [Hibiscus sabdariffa]|uniref:Uncharacterized protein n=1 Tax=Hibiscus sabdariffa TaxID=183260 RepID=A0ABR2T7B8_9ROSI
MVVASHGKIDNKENIPRFSSKTPTLVLKKPLSSNKIKRSLRTPLQDITNLLLPQICSTTVQSDSASQVLVSHAKCWKKRVENELGSILNKTCLVYKSGNFR